MALFRYTWWKQGILILGILGILVFRLWNYWSSGQFVAEDGRVFFADAYNHSWVASILLPYAGYFHVLPRLLAELLSLFPLAWQPEAFAWSGMVTTSLLLSLFYLPHFRPLVPGDMARGAGCLLLPLLPNAENLGTVFGLHWYLSFALALAVIMKFPKSTAGQAALVTGSILAIWSAPATLVLFPFFLWRAVRSRQPGEAIWCRICLVNFCLFGLLVVLLRLQGADRTGAFSWSELLPALNALILRGWLGSTFLGMGAAHWLAQNLPWLLSLIGLLGFIGLLYLLLRKASHPVAGLGWQLLGIALLMIGLSLTRSLYLSELAQNPLPRHDRYLAAPTLLLFILLLALVYPLIQSRTKLSLLVALGFSLAQIFGVPYQSHWSRAPGLYSFREYLPAIRQWEQAHEKSPAGASLYLPHDIPYDGVVLEIQGGEIRLPEEGLAQAIDARPTNAPGSYQSWLGRFQAEANAPWIVHEAWGRLEFLGLWGGRVWFRDEQDRLYFTSQLLYPRLWVLQEDRFSLRAPRDPSAENQVFPEPR